MEVDNHHFCELLRLEPTPRMPEEELMLSEVAILSGGRDQSGRPLVTFPSQHHEILESRVKASGLDRILRYYIDVTSPTTKVHGFAFIADLRFSSLDFISMLKSSLNSLQAETTSVVGPFVLYLIQPINKRSLKDAQTLLALRQSKKKKNKHIPSTLFQTTTVADEMDLYNHVDKSQVTADLGGYLQYSHSAWVKFRKVVEPFFVQYEEMIPKLPDAFNRLEELGSFDLGETREDLDNQRDTMQQLIQDVFRELNIDVVSHHCSDILSKLAQPDSDETFAAVAQKPVFREVRLLAEYCREKMTMIQQRLGIERSKVEGRLSDEARRMDLVEEMRSLSQWLSQEGAVGLKKLEVADSLGRAEMLCNHFETGVASLAEEKLNLVTELQDQALAIISDDDGHAVANLRSAMRDLEEQAEIYNNKLDDRRQLLSVVRNYYGLYDKMARWCGKTLKFLPYDIADLLDDISDNRAGGRRRRSADRAEDQWVEDVEGFLRKHRPPKDEDLVALTEYAETIGERVRKKKAKSLCHRCTVLLSVLDTEDLATRQDALQARKWKSEIVGSRDKGRHDDDPKERSRERKDGDGVEEPRTDLEERESEIDDPLLRRIGRRKPEVGGQMEGQQDKGQRSRRASSKENIVDGEERRGESGENVEVEEAKRRKKEKEEKRRRKEEEKMRMEEEGNVREDDREVEERIKEKDRGREKDQWMRPSKDFWAGRITGVVRPKTEMEVDSVDGTMPQTPYTSKPGHDTRAGRYDQAQAVTGAPNASGLYPSIAHAQDGLPMGAVPQYLNRNQNANPSPGISHALTPQYLPHMNPAQQTYHGDQSQMGLYPVNQSQVQDFQTSQAPYANAGVAPMSYGIPPSSLQALHSQGYVPHHMVNEQTRHLQNPGMPQTCTLYDPLTGQPYQVYLQSLRSASLQGEPRQTGYHSDSQHSYPGRGIPSHLPQQTQRLVDHHVSAGMHALSSLVRPNREQVASQDRMHALNIGLSSSHSGRSTPRSDHTRELSPYEDVLNRIGQLRVRARRNSRDKRTSQHRAADIRPAKSVPNLSSLLAGVHVGTPGNLISDDELILRGDRQSDYYARLGHLEDRSSHVSSQHATKKWVSRLMDDDLHFADAASHRSASPAVQDARATSRVPRPLTPHEKYELESLTSLLNETESDNDDSAPMSPPLIGESGSRLPSRSRVLPMRPGKIDFDADQRELDQIRQNLSGSYAEPGADLQLSVDSLHADVHSSNQYSSSAHTSAHSHPSPGDRRTHSHASNHSGTFRPSPHSLATSQGNTPYQNQTRPFQHGGVPGSEGPNVAPVTDQLREFFGDVETTEAQLLSLGLEERLRNVHVAQVEERVTHADLSTPNFLSAAMDTLVKMDAADRHLGLPLEASDRHLGLPLEARRHQLQRDPSLQLSDEGVIIDGASWDGTLEAGSAATTERESVESGVGSRGQASNL